MTREPTGRTAAGHTDTTRRHLMYDMYPDWGPASHDPDNPRSHEAVQVSLDLRDNGGLRPDDN
ncbi:MAG TPA: hypothetical protein VD814_08470 [Nocardioides sp.]|nr:hypothetical protein [Nocardioides sp.]